jgi:tripartite-type tricarboxylate transporter receptor subunit TctC
MTSGLLRFARSALLVATTLSAAARAAQAQSAADFFRRVGRITMYVGASAGGGYDQIARLVAANLSNHLPGSPNVVIEDMPTASGVRATNFVYHSTPHDGSVILAGANSSLALPIYNSPVAHYDPRKFEWIGSTGKQQAICVTSKASGVTTLDDAKKKIVTVSAGGVTGGPGVYPAILNSMFGTKFKVIAGYTMGGLQLAVDRGEVQGRCGYAWESYQAIGSKWFKDKTVNILVQFGLEKNPDLPVVPLATDLLADPTDKQVLNLIVLPQEFGRPFVAPPGVPADRMKIYRQAFQDMLKDPKFLAMAKIQRIILEPLDDAQIQALLAQAYATTKEVHDRVSVFASQMN